MQDGAPFPAQSSVLDESVLVHRVVSAYDTGPVRTCHFLCRGDADIYRVTGEGVASYLKVFRPPKKKSHAEAEACLVARLAEASVPVVRPMKRLDGAYASEVRASEGLRPVLLFDEAPPPLPAPERVGTETMERLGTVVGRMHDVIDRDGAFYDVPTVDLDSFLADRAAHLRRFADEAGVRVMNEAAIRIRPQLAEVPRTAPEWGVCHGDLVLSNVRTGPDGVTLFDFGDVAKTYRGFDLSVVYWSLGHRFLDRREELWGAFLRGYEAIRRLPESLQEKLPAFLILRELRFLGGNAASLPLRLGTEPFESDFISDGFQRIRAILGDGNLARPRAV